MREIKEVQFGVLSPDEIHKLSVCEVTSSKLSGPNTVYDDRMGPMDSKQICPTCKEISRLCPGHIGHINLNERVVHPMYQKYITSLLKCFCFKCHSLLIAREHLSIGSGNINHLSGEARFKLLHAQISKCEYCTKCAMIQPKFVFSVADGLMYMTYKSSDTQKQNRLIVSPSDISNVFENITDEDLLCLGIDPKRTHPKNLVLSVLPVIAPRSRPYVLADHTVCDDDLTIQYIEIIKINAHLSDISLPEPKRQKYISILNFRVKCLMDNSHGKSRHTNNRSLRGLKERLSGKQGLIRSHLMGKRTDQSSRTVIGPDVNIPMGWMCIPPEVASILTIPEKVTDFNRKWLEELIDKEQANFIVHPTTDTRINLKYAMYKVGTSLLPNDVIVRNGRKIYVKYNTTSHRLLTGDVLIRNGVVVTNAIPWERKKIELKNGMIVERQLRDGDIVLLNRQPT